MCTVTFLPLGSGDFALTSNRDEAPGRSPAGLSQHRWFGETLVYPEDTLAHGTWIATSGDDRLVCVLNGAFLRHKRELPYRRSRGLMVLDYFSFSDAQAFFRDYTFYNMEPFTFISWDRGRLQVLRWDGQEKHLRDLPVDQLHLWSSATLYPPAIQAKREQWMADFQAGTPQPTATDILSWHHTAGDGDPENDVIMDRKGIVQTVSITQVQRRTEGWQLRYEDLLHQSVDEASLPLTTNSPVLV